ncbi:MAG: class A beta-lactamase-related serine hydrolase [Bacteroidota bacterium]|nr:serine hydrolase [Flavisolibacter sp.]MBD0294619.1 serine hydrolase [Flavisolibacter sp.]MBD0349765.1 serine hydrolase [Flavisolibacter sp.]MBD0374091.1 serine hydrolase [Flavisolibacter sp.]MDQ3843585.1 class A beta-lactamase-related serine hydrolase [Bacteroidota bacterium]
MRRAFKLLLLLLLVHYGIAQRTDKKLQRQIQNLIQGFHGDIGMYVKNLHNGKTVAINDDTLFPTASMVKIPILIGVMDKIYRGELDYHQPLQYKDSLLYEGVDILGSFKQDEKIDLDKVIMLMLTMSDNTASLWLQSLAGTGIRINQILDSLGFQYTRVNSRTQGREANRAMYGWGQTTPREMASLMEKIYRGEIISRVASDRMLRNLKRNYWDAVALSQIPPYVTVFSKNGAVDQSRSEVLLVKGRKAEYVFCVATKNNRDESWQNSNEAWQLTRKISALLWHYFEPGDKWQPAADADKFN